MARYRETECVGRGHALILNDEDRVAVMLEDCGDPGDSGVRAGNLVNYLIHPEAEPKIVGNPASIVALWTMQVGILRRLLSRTGPNIQWLTAPEFHLNSDRYVVLRGDINEH